MDKRTFLKTSALGLGSLANFSALGKLVDSVSHLPAEEVAKAEDFWGAIRKGYKLKPDYINLENGYYSIQPEEILEAFVKHIRDVNLQGAYYMRTVQYDNKKTITAKLAAEFPHISTYQGVFGGVPHLTGHRFAVTDVLSALSIYGNITAVLDAYDNRYTEEEMKAALEYAAAFIDECCSFA